MYVQALVLNIFQYLIAALLEFNVSLVLIIAYLTVQVKQLWHELSNH